MAFGLSFYDLAPGLRVAGDSVAYVYKFTKKGGQGDGLSGLEVGLTDDPTIKLLEGAVSGFVEVADVDPVYTTMVGGGLTELVAGLAIAIDSISSIDTDASTVRLGLAGSQPVLQFRKATVQAVTKIGDGGYTWDLPAATFEALKIAADSYESDLDGKIDELIADRLSGDTFLQGLIGDQATSDAAARAVIQSALDAEVITRGDTDATIIASVDAEATARETADTALSGRLDVLEADPTTSAAVAAGDSATLSSANTYTDTADAVLSGRIDALEADPTTATAVAAVQADVDQNEADSDAADAALSGRLDVLEADPTTATALAAVQSDVDQNEADGDAADAALSGRLDTLEADPTTATALATGLALKADLAGSTFTGDVTIDEGTGSTIKLETSDATSAGIHIEGPTGSMGYIDTTNGFGNDSLQVYSANFWVRAINNGTGNVIIDGQLTASGLVNAANDGDAATAGVPLNGLYHHNGDMKIRLT